jgi:diguanylate cyclase (GGDEF)-like protein
MGLGGRRELVAALGAAMERFAIDPAFPEGGGGAESAGPVAVLVDVDDFRRVTDAFGFTVGDQVLDHLAEVLLEATRPGDVVTHLGGSTFGVCAGPLATDEVAGYVAALRSAIGLPIELGGSHVTLRTSVGTAGSIVDRPAHDLLQEAYLALSRAKELGGDRACAFDEGLRQRVHRRVEVETLVRRAIFLQAIELHYQPIMRLEGRSVVGAEALLRLVDDDGVPVPAREVIELAERSGLMIELGALILRTACRQAATWQQLQPGRHLTVSVNVSARQLEDDHLPGRVEEILAETGLDPSRLCLEVTETVLMADTERSVHLLTRLKARGVSVAADDFGTGYCSLSYLTRFPIDAVKADLSFVAGLPNRVEDVAVVTAVMGIARALDLRVVAEGVENVGQLDALDRLECGFAQGHLWSPALPGPAFAEFAGALPLRWRTEGLGA